MGVGFQDVCAIRVSGELECWDALNDLNFDDMTATVESLLFSQLDFSYFQVCAVSVEGRVWCSRWGYEFEPSSPPGLVFESVTVGGVHVCGLLVGGEARCWEGDPYESGGLYGLLSPPGGVFVELHAGVVFTCGLRVGGEIECWGLRDAGSCYSVPTGAYVHRFDDLEFPDVSYMEIRLCPGWNRDPVPDAEFATFGVLTTHPRSGVSNWHPGRICGVTVVGELLCWNDGMGLPQRPPAGRFVAVDAGADHACALDEAGEVACWGRLPATLEAPGSRSDTNTSMWRQDAAVWVRDASGAAGWEVPSGPFMAVSSGWRHSCGLRESGVVVCWGEDLYGETEAPGGEFAAVSAGRRLTCGLRRGGVAECWGRGSWWAASPPPSRLASLALSKEEGDIACGLDEDGEAVCWGRGSAAPEALTGPFESLSLTHQLCGLRGDGTVDCEDIEEASAFDYTTSEVAEAGGYVSLSGSDRHGCGLTVEGEAVCWSIKSSFPLRVPDGPFSAVSAGRAHACGIRGDATLECWYRYGPPGWELPAAAGQPDRPAVKHPSAVGSRDLPERRGVPAGLEWVSDGAPAGRFTTIHAGDDVTCGLSADGAMQCWGAPTGRLYREGPYTSLAVGAGLVCWVAEDSGDSPASSGGSASYVKVAMPARPSTSEVLRRDPRLESYATSCWSELYDGLPPRGFLADRSAERAPLGEVAAFDAGFIDCVAPAAGGVICGEITGLYDSYERDPPTRDQPPASGTFTHLSVGYGWGWPEYPDSYNCCVPPLRYGAYAYQRACAIYTHGGLSCWGDNQYGEGEPPPTWLGLAPYRDVAAGFVHTCVLDRDHRAVCWGDDTHGQTTAPKGEFTQITAGRWHTCGLRPDGEVECWGNGPGGNEDIYDAPPEGAATEPPEGPFTQIAAGRSHTCALRPNGKPECWYSY